MGVKRKRKSSFFKCLNIIEFKIEIFDFSYFSFAESLINLLGSLCKMDTREKKFLNRDMQ